MKKLFPLLTTLAVYVISYVLIYNLPTLLQVFGTSVHLVITTLLLCLFFITVWLTEVIKESK